jgi:signal transduction histidine kinase
MSLCEAETNAFDLPRLCGYFSEKSPQPMVAVEGPAHVVRYVNSAFARLAEKPADELLGRALAEAVPLRSDNNCLALLDRVFRTGKPENLAEQEQRASPQAYWSYEMWAVLGLDERPAGVMIQVTDVTDAAIFRRQARAMNEALVVSAVRQHELIDTIAQGEKQKRELEAQMFQAQKLESLGVLAGGIAHDLNNMLTPVLGYVELAAKTLPEGAPAAPMLDEAGKNARRAADLVQQILAYAGKGRFIIQLVDLSGLVRDMGGLLEAAVSINAKLEYDLAPALPFVEADATQLRQVVMNLVKNASEALAELPGTITMRTGLIAAASPPPCASGRKTDLPKGPAVFLEVSDSGCGMTADVVEKVFDPFFTTKFTGRGLGLAVVQGIVRGHHGALQVHSAPHKGSTFRLLLPCSERTSPAPAVSKPSTAWHASGTILVIDDDERVLDIVQHLLQFAGLSVLIATAGEDGLATFRKDPQRIKAVLLDLTMPKTSGLEIARALRLLRPDLPILLMSGYSVEEASRQCEGLGIAGFVQKPFDSSGLLTAIQQALGPCLLCLLWLCRFCA